MSEEEFFRKYEAYDREAFRATIICLIENRERLRDIHIRKLENIMSNLLKRIQGITKQQIAEELKRCRDVLMLYRRFFENGQ